MSPVTKPDDMRPNKEQQQASSGNSQLQKTTSPMLSQSNRSPTSADDSDSPSSQPSVSTPNASHLSSPAMARSHTEPLPTAISDLRTITQVPQILRGITSHLSDHSDLVNMLVALLGPGYGIPQNALVEGLGVLGRQELEENIASVSCGRGLVGGAEMIVEGLPKGDW
ncbi:hypothetical protein P154DRAFT_583589 [Amniculicola lignicola CBS 123094]|uniref:Uncharacterized protein n=1 Tax=Amniculicola lignicola CBS 123094 TaxID=1392246 RepID=A0A6A5VVH9_9PLEO|nr:hypothetical protein P154DRAFT_583589 [Amniculicola lignicola CBS 123094]